MGINSQYASFKELLSGSTCSYQQLVENEGLIAYLVDQASEKLASIRTKFPNAGGLIVASSVTHANKIAEILQQRQGEKAYIATYREEDPLSTIKAFKNNSEKWIVSVGMISEGTNIPRLRVCCHLTRVKTELHFRQVLGRILRSNGELNSEAFLYMPAEPDLIEYANRIAQEIPDGAMVKFEVMSKSIDEGSKPITLKKENSSDIDLVLNSGLNVADQSMAQYRSQNQIGPSLLARNYEMSMNVFGKFKQELMVLGLECTSTANL